METLTRDEKAVLSQYLTPPRGTVDIIFAYSVYIFPSLAFALYGVSKGDFVAVGVAYFVLLLMCVLYLNRQRRDSPGFRAALTKLIERLEYLEQRPDGDREVAGEGREVTSSL